jgi:hypothetical protein
MFVSFEALPCTARIWIYQSTRKFDAQELKKISETATAFCEQWTAHGHSLKTSFSIDHQQFLILAVDEASAGASGCSIDGSVRMLKQLQGELGTDFFERTKIPFLVENEVVLVNTSDLKKAFSDGVLNSASLTFNILTATKEELEKGWIVPSGKTWLSKYLTKSAVA